MEEEISLRELIEVLLKGRKLIGIITAVAVILSVVVSFMMSPVYEARATLLANPIGSKQNKEITNSNDVLDTISQYPEMTIETYKEQFLNSEVVQATIIDLDLKDSEGNPMKIRSLRDKVTLEVVDKTNLIRVFVKDEDPEVAAKIANSLSENFIKFITRMTKRKGEQAVQAINEQLEATKKMLDEEAQKKRDYLKNAKDIEELNQEIVALRDQLTVYKQNLIDTDKQIHSDLKSLEALENSGIKSTNINIGAIKAKIQLNEVQGITNTNNTNNSSDSEQDGQVNTSRPSNTQNNTGSNMTIGQEIEFDVSNSSVLEGAMLAAHRTQMETRLIQNISEKEVLEQKIEEIQNRLTELRATLATEEYKYNEVMRNYELAEQSFQAYQAKKNEAEQNVAADIGKASIIISTSAVVPDVPSSPNKILNIAIGFVLGLMIGVFVVFFKSYWENTESK
ncbi:GumC family protein [Defluviitalea saccharophila]|uniref:Wzz/FepE/Etk N-terminal domain-containing protein n=1 Tax=Defluviitalea saccharophila TaxID=879970 RepID=A0ABZ2Y4B3_9FIRM